MRPSTSELLKPAASMIALVAIAAFTLGARLHFAARTNHNPGAALQPLPVEQPRELRPVLSRLPLAFESNQGQADPRVRYLAHGEGYTLLLTASDVLFALNPLASTRARSNHGLIEKKSPTLPVPREDEPAVIRMQFLEVNRKAAITAKNPLPGRSNYFVGDNPERWQTNVPQYARVSYEELYPGVSLAFHGEQRQVEFDFIVSAGADPAAIRFGISNASNAVTDDAGNLVLSSMAGEVTLHKPVAYQNGNGPHKPVDARFVLLAENQIGFQLGRYDHSCEVVIDPSVSYATYLGGLAEDQGNAIAIDASGDAYITGQTASTNFPTAAGDYSRSNAGGLDVFVSKISADGSTLLYSTYVGGSGNDAGSAIVVNASGAAFVAGETASATDFPITQGAFQTTFGGGGLDAFVFELNATGSSLTYSTYLGGAGDDIAKGLALDSSGNSYIVGSTNSSNFPTLNAIQATPEGAAGAFVSKLNASGSGLIFSTYLGGSENDFASAVALDSSNNVYVTGATQDPTFPVTQGAFQMKCGTDGTCNGGLADAFVTVFKAEGGGFIYSTFLGGEGIDQGNGIAVDSNGDAYVTGLTFSQQFPILKPAIQSNYGGDQDAFITAFYPSGNALLYSTYLGGSLNDAGTGIVIDGSNNVYVTGQTGSSDFPVTTNATQSHLGGDNDAFVTEINASGSTGLFSTYLGGSLNENAAISIATGNTVAEGAIAVDSPGANIYVTGNTFSTDFPTQSPLQAANAGEGDAFIAKYTQSAFTISSSPLAPSVVTPGGSATSTIMLAALNGFSRQVALTCSVSPMTTNPPTCSLSPTSIASGTPSTLTVTTAASTTPGSYIIRITGTSGGIAHTATTSLSVQDFSVAASAFTPPAINPGSSATSSVTVSPIEGFSNAVNLTCAVSPASPNSPTCSLSPGSALPGTPSALTVAAPVAAPGAVYTVTVTATSGSDVHTTTAKLTVNGFLISATAPAAVNPGSPSTSTVTLTALNGYDLPVELSCNVTGSGSPLPGCAAQSFSLNPVTPTSAGVQTVLTITTTAPAGATARQWHIAILIWFPAFGLLFSLRLASTPQQRKVAGTLFLIAFMIVTFSTLPSCGGSVGTCSALPTVLTGLSATSTTSTATILTWNTPTTIGTGNCGSVSYTLYQNSSKIGTSSMTSFTATGLSAATTYTFTVAASDNAGMGPQSAGLQVTTQSGATPAGDYTVTVTGTDANGLSNSTQVTLTVN
jgi:hypothetical protein